MNGSLSKKLRKTVNKKFKYDLAEVARILSEASLRKRIKYAFRIVFKYKIGERLNG